MRCATESGKIPVKAGKLSGKSTGHAHAALKNDPVPVHDTMLQETFLFLPGVNERTETRLWSCGIRTWDHLLETTAIPGVSRERLSFWKGRVRHAQELVRTPDGVRALVRQLGTRHAWRAAREILDEPRYLDIETTEHRGDVTVVGASDGECYLALIKGRTLDANGLRRLLAGATCLITFNGSSFDLPILDRRFPAALPDVPHLDLRHICAQAGLRGGLKRIEEHLGVRRADALRDVDGTDAILLWYRHALGDAHALTQLVEYNSADVLNLASLLDLVVPALWRHVRHGAALPWEPCLARLDA